MRRLSFLGLFLALAAAALAEEGAPQLKSLASLPAPARDALSWLPADCDTLFVSTALELRFASAPPGPKTGPRMSLLEFMAFGDALAVPALENKSAAWAIHAHRGTEVVSAFGSLRYEGCTIFGLGSLTAEDRQALTSWLAENARSIGSEGKATVYKFPSSFVREGVYPEKPWEGVFVTWANDALIVATSDTYLRELLARVAQADRKIAVPASVLDWSDVAPWAAVWGVRAFPAKTEPIRPEARTTFFAKDRVSPELRVVYRPAIPDGLAAATRP